MGLIIPDDSTIRPEELTLDYYLVATPLFDGSFRNYDMSGKQSYRIDAFTESKGFGITNIELDLKPNLQPLISITFKDLYGNLLFNRDLSSSSSYGDIDNFRPDILFQLPYPKFKLSIKGYLGDQVNFLLQLKSTKTNYQPSDGSFEIKAEFVPNIFGFFNDIPYKYLFAVSELKNKLGDKSATGENSSIIEIAKIGAQVTTTIRQVEDKYSSLRDKITAYSGDLKLISDNYNEKKITLEKITGDDDLINGGFSAMTFNISLGNLTIPKDDTSRTLFGSAILASINNPQKIEYKDANSLNQIKNIVESDAGKRQIQNSKALITANLDIIQRISVAKGFQTVTERKIDTQTIFNVMTRLAGDCAYVLGFILEGGLKGYNGNPNRVNVKKLIGLFYPLVEEEKIGESTTFGEQKPWSEAKFEIDQVDLFVDALMSGAKRLEEIKQEIEDLNQPAPDPVSADQQPQLDKKLSNLETSRNSPYTNKADNIINNLIQRSGLMASGYAGSINSDPTGKPIPEFVNNEFSNLSSIVTELEGTELKKLETFCKTVTDNFTDAGKLKSGTMDSAKTKDNITLRKYFGSKFNNFLDAGPQKSQFKNNNPESLISVYTYNNGLLYYNQKALVDTVKSQLNGANDLLAGKPQVLAYVENKYLPTKENLGISDNITPSELFDKTKKTLIGSGNTDSKISNLGNPTFYAWYFFKGDKNKEVNIIEFPNKATQSIFINYEKLFLEASPGKKTPDQLIVKYNSNDPKVPKPSADAAVFRLIDAEGFENPKDWVINLENDLNRAYLFGLCNKITQALLEKQNQEKQNASGGGVGAGGGQVAYTELTAAEKESIKAETRKSVYVQFHHICQAWITLANAENPDSDVLPTGTNFQLRNKLENLYRSNNPNSNFFLNFTFPVLDENTGVDVAAAIINTDPLLEDNSQTSTLNMMQNICTQNNFLLQPIPGGVTSNLDRLFTPYKTSNDFITRNALSVIWSPTPENRYTNNKNESIYPEKDFIKMPSLVNSTKPIPCLQYGSPKNIVLKSVKAGTDDNKVTSESLAATSAIVNNTNTYRKKGFDCSMLSIMQGRSYKISLDLLGNAQIFPTMHLVLDGIPIFTGLYWVTEVQHKITPNNMETTLEAVKLKYVGGKGENSFGKFAAIPPVTKNSLVSFVGKGTVFGGGQDANTQNLCNSGDLNEEFCKQVKDIKITKSSDLDRIIKQFTQNKYSDFCTWFNSEIFNKCPLAKTQINKQNFDKVWSENFISSLWNKYGNAGINFIEFLTIHSVIYNEVGGDYKSLREQMNDVNAKDSPGVAYAFDTIGDKISYNGGFNSLASDLFLNTNFVEAHKNKKFGDDPTIRTLKEWSENKPGKFPVSAFANVPEAVATSPTFINEADFYKYSGRGLVKMIWRTSYKLLAESIMSYSGNDQKIMLYKNTWSQAPYYGNIDNILNITSGTDWDDLFDNSDEMKNLALAIFWKNGSKIKDSQYIDITQNKNSIKKAVENIAKSITDKRDYLNTYMSRVYIILDQLYPDGVPKKPKPPDNNQTPTTNNNNNTPTRNINSNEIKLTYGTLYIPTPSNAPLIVVLGGLSLCGGESSVYMKKYIASSPTQDIFKNNIVFITTTFINTYNEMKTTYTEIFKTLRDKNINYTSKTLYGFSAGWRGVNYLLGTNSPISSLSEWNKIVLVDLYLASAFTFFKGLVANQKVIFVYRSSDALNQTQKDEIIAAAANPVKSNDDSHCNSNKTGVQYI